MIAYVILGAQPKLGASADTLVSLHSGDRRILIATIPSADVARNRLSMRPANDEYQLARQEHEVRAPITGSR